ncbi:protocatechuate 3,4-dioxygenase subunit beta [Azotobacter armeniacus]
MGKYDNDLLLNFNHGGLPVGERVIMCGRVLDPYGNPGPHTLVEMWQANAGGRYRHKNDSYLAPLDPNFGGVGRTLTDADGYYYFRTIKPGPYPWRNGPNEWRPSHIHVSISGPSISTKLITQMYFEGDPLIPKCPIVRAIANPAAVETLTGRLDLSSNVPMDCLAYRFNIVLRGRRQTRFENQ